MLALLTGTDCILPGKVSKAHAVYELVAGRFVAASCAPISRWKHSAMDHDALGPAREYGGFAIP